MNRLFGTDGIRGKALVPPLDEDTVRRLGVALAAQLRPQRAHPHLLLAGDTRASTNRLAYWLGSSFAASGGRVTWGEVLPTPAVSHLLRSGDFDAGAVISASHNPADDNGIKVLSPTGEKLADEAEQQLEHMLGEVAPVAGPGLPPGDRSLAEHYLSLLALSHPTSAPLAGLHVVVDAANGAASFLAEPLLQRLGAQVTMTHNSPNGTNINASCGATAPASLAATVVRLGADAGIALDGDADRVVLVDEQGTILDGDDILLAWARHLDGTGSLPGKKVVATVMSNLGLEKALQKEGIELIRCPVGDRSVWLAMQKNLCVLGGEQSGHVICSHHTVSGDGLLTGTHLLAIAAAQRCPVSHISDLHRLPQVVLNVPVRRRLPFAQVPALCQKLDATEHQLDNRGRVLLRYSGTEQVVRVMVEGEDAAEIDGLANLLAETIRQELA
jgi:phosphoglucosamine mutase